MEKRVLLAVFLSFLVLFVYQSLVVGPQPPEEGGAESRPAQEPQLAPGAAALQDLAPQAAASGAGAPPAPSGPAADVVPRVSDEGPREIVVEGEWIRAKFSNRGAVLVSWQLKDYLDEDGQPVELVPQLNQCLDGDGRPVESLYYPDGQPVEARCLDENNQLVELVPRELSPGEPWPFSLMLDDDPQLTARLDQALFKPSVYDLRLSGESATLVFEYEDSSGLKARKEFRFQPDSYPYLLSFTAEVSSGAGALNPRVRWGPAVGGTRPGAARIALRPGGLRYGSDERVRRVTPSAVRQRSSYDGPFDFVGVDGQYFLVAALPGPQRQARVDYAPVCRRLDCGSPVGWFGRLFGRVEADVIAPGIGVDLVAFDVSLADGPTDLTFFLGPKDFDVLQAVHPDLVRSINFGRWLSTIVVPLHKTLNWINGSVGNYGWSIIILTILINIAIFPLNHKSVVSMRKMQELQPEMKAIQARYKDLKTTDPAKQKMNTELMNLYRERGVNPAGGCLPMLLTMPVLFAFFRLLPNAIELWGAPFMFWITDLSQRDPLYIAPLLMGGSMFLQQRMTPATGGDPMQQKMMMYMPVFFLSFFLFMPSGLVLYWLTSNVFRIGQQILTNRIIGPPVVRTVRPPAERRVKKAGSGKTEAVKEGA